MPNLEEFIDGIAGSGLGPAPPVAGPATASLIATFRGDNDRAQAIIAANFWKAFVASSLFASFNWPGSLSPGTAVRSEKVIVYRSAQRRFDLLLFAPVPMETMHILVQPSRDNIWSGWMNWRQQVPSGQLDPILWNADLALEALDRISNFGIAIVQTPPTRSVSAPDPPAEVVCPNSNSTAGVVAKRQGKDGVTAALHAVGSHTTPTVAGNSGTVPVGATDPISDSCFIEVIPPPVGSQAPNKIMQNILPRGKENASFGRGSNKSTVSTTISGWALELPQISNSRQDKIYTTNDLSSTDSGTALITSDGFIVGFAFEQSSGSSAVDHSSWIWAHSVVDVLNLTV
jgi:hypothetical protein